MIKYFIYICLVCIGLYSCKSTKGIVKEGERVKSMNHHKLVSQIVDSQLVFNNLYIKKFDGTLEFDNNKFGFKGAMFIKSDSSIVISVMPMMGIEMFKAYISPHKVILIDRTKKQVMEGSFDYLKKMFSIMLEYRGFESLLTNKLEGINCNSRALDCLHNYDSDAIRDKYLLTSLDKRQLSRVESRVNDGVNLVEYKVLPKYFRVSDVSIRNLSNGDNVNVTYTGFSNYGDFVFPKSIKIVGDSKGKRVVFNMDINQIEKNSTNELGFKVPEKFNTIILK